MKTIILVFTIVLSLVTSAEAVTPSEYCKNIQQTSASTNSAGSKISCEILDVQVTGSGPTGNFFQGSGSLASGGIIYLVKYCKDGVLNFTEKTALTLLTSPGYSTATVPLNSANCRYLPN